MVPMTLRRQVTFWIVAVAVFVAALWLFSGVLLPFVAGMGLAYLLNPLAHRLEMLGMGRVVASLVIVGIVVLAIVVLMLLIAPIAFNQLASLLENVPGYMRRLQQILTERAQPWLNRSMGVHLPSSDVAVSDFVEEGAGWLTTFLRSLWSGGRALISIFSLIVVMPVVTFYLLCDWQRLIATVDGWVPVKSRDTVRALACEIDAALSGFMRGQTLVCLLLGSYYAIGLTLVGLHFGVLIGLLAGLISFIPYIGSMTGLVLAIGVAMAQFWPDWTWIALVLAVFLFGQFIEGNILSPKLVGASVGLHPLWLIFALFAFGYLFGFLGLLIAVPVAAAIGVLARFAMRQYLASAIYTGEGPN
jgi:predicted PurR-regulated permease PerM